MKKIPYGDYLFQWECPCGAHWQSKGIDRDTFICPSCDDTDTYWALYIDEGKK